MLLLPGHNSRVRALCFSPDGSSLATGGGDWAVLVWDLPSGNERLTLRGHYGNIIAVVYSPDGRLIASTSRERHFRIWSADTGEARKSIPVSTFDDSRSDYQLNDLAQLFTTIANRHEAEAAAWRLTSASQWSPWGNERTPGADVFEIPVNTMTWTLAMPRTTLGTPRGAFVPGCAFSRSYPNTLLGCYSPDGCSFAVTYSRSVFLCNVPWHRPSKFRRILGDTNYHSLNGHQGDIWTLAFSPDGRTLATGSHDRTVRLWDVASGKERACFDWQIGMIDTVAFSPDGMTVAAGGIRGIMVWDVGGDTTQ